MRVRARDGRPMAGRTGQHRACTRPVPERREAAAAAARDAGTAVAKPADGARAALADQKAHRGRADHVESCRSHRTHRISKGAGRAGRLEACSAVRGLVATGRWFAMSCFRNIYWLFVACDDTCARHPPGSVKNLHRWAQMRGSKGARGGRFRACFLCSACWVDGSPSQSATRGSQSRKLRP